MTPTEVIKWLENCAESRASAFGPRDSSTLACTDAANSVRNAMRVFHEAQQQNRETINQLRDQLKAASSETVSRAQWEALYDSRDKERSRRKAAEARLAKIETHIMESNYYGSVMGEPRGAAKVLHEVLVLANKADMTSQPE